MGGLTETFQFELPQKITIEKNYMRSDATVLSVANSIVKYL